MAPAVMFSILASLGGGRQEDDSNNKALNEVCVAPKTQPSPSRSFFGAEFSAMFSYNSTSSSSPSKKKIDKRLFVASASELVLTVDDQVKASSFGGGNGRRVRISHAAIFVPPSLLEDVFQKHTSNLQSHAQGSSFWLDETASQKVSKDLMLTIHPSLETCNIRGIILTTIASEMSATAEIVLIDLTTSGATFDDIVHATNGQSMADENESIIKMLPISQILFCPILQTLHDQQQKSRRRRPCLPTCPVCLHRIDTSRLGLPQPRNEDLCSKFCPFPGINGYSSSVDSRDFCVRQRLLKRWPAPSRCTPCGIIDHYWQQPERESDTSSLYCAECAMHKTLWVCLTCGFVGCGRYSNKHSIAHFQRTGHPYSLELATLRIWDYEDGEAGGYAHRPDFLDCPSSPPLASPWMVSHDTSMAAAAVHSGHAGIAHMRASQQHMVPGFPIETEKSPKKAIMIGEEYEALLQSALEDQAQYYQGEMARLQAELSASLADETTMTQDEINEIEQLREDISNRREEIGKLSKQLLDVQAQEATQRAASQKLLREQQVAKDVLSKLQEDARAENQKGRIQIQELEQQIADLTTNLRMRHEFSQNEELSNAQIYGTTGKEKKKRGKKKGRSARK